MKRFAIAAALWPAWWLPAQTAQTVMFRAPMFNTAGDSGAADLLLHLVKDSAGTLVSGSVDIYVTYQFANDSTITAMGVTDATGTLTLATGVSAASPILATAGSGRIWRQVQVPPGDQAGLAVLNGMLADISQYGVRLVTPDQMTGLLSQTFVAAQTATFMAPLTSGAASGVATVSITYAGAPWNIYSAEVATQAVYQFPSQVTFSSMRIFAGQGVDAQLEVPALLLPGTPSAASGTGVLTAPPTQIDNPQLVQAVQNLLTNPGSFSVNITTADNPTDPLVGTLRGTDTMTFPIAAFAGSGGASAVTLHTLRDNSGNVTAGAATFDVNYRLAAGAQISGLDIDGTLAAPAVTTDASGSGNAYALTGVYNGAGLASLNDIVRHPEAHHIDLQTTASGSPITASLAAANTAVPSVAAVIPIVEVKDLSTFAPGELVEIYGTNLAKVTTDLSGWPGGSLPSTLNGVSASIAGQTARILYVSPYQVDALLPFETPTGSQPLSVDNGNGPSAPISLDVAGVAPALYGFAFKNADFTIVGPSNPAQAGDVLVLYATGLGQTTPALATGQTVPLGPPFYDTVLPTVTIGGVNATVDYSIGAPPYVAGLYQMAVTVPAGLPTGSVPVVATAGGQTSNTITITVF